MSRHAYTPEEQAFYRAYLQSTAWKRRRQSKLSQADYRCEFRTARPRAGQPHPERCCQNRFLEVHHNTYERLGREVDSDLDVLCWFHHMLEHLLWKRCSLCGQPCLGDEERGELWLQSVLATLEINLDDLPDRAWRQLPPKEFFLAIIPHACIDCRNYIQGD